jgi:hypothetical protein
VGDPTERPDGTFSSTFDPSRAVKYLIERGRVEVLKEVKGLELQLLQAKE